MRRETPAADPRTNVSTRKHRLTPAEIAEAFAGDACGQTPVVLSPEQVAGLIGRSRKTVYDWLTKGRLEGTYRKRGKHILFWRNRVLDRIYNGPEWHT